MYNLEVMKECGASSVLVYEQVKELGGDNDFIPLTTQYCIESMGMTLMTQHRAIERLKDKGFIETKITGHPLMRLIKIVR